MRISLSTNGLLAAAAIGMLPAAMREQLMRMAEDQERLDVIHHLTGASKRAIRDYLSTKPYSLWALYHSVRCGGEAYQDLIRLAIAEAVQATP